MENNEIKEILKEIVANFSTDKLLHFFRFKNRNFKPLLEDLPNYETEDFTDCKKLGVINLQDNNLIVCTFKVLKELTERSSKKKQYELGRKILKETNADAGIFVFYDKNGNFRFSLIYTEYFGTKRKFSYFKRFTYFVSPTLTNKTFIKQISEGDFLTLEGIKQAFSVEPVRKQFYEEIQNWYFWAIDEVEFPDDEDKDREIRNAKNLIRLITRMIFVWFMKVKGLIPDTLFDKKFIDKILNYKDKTGSTYYKAILQNLFFATLNTQMRKDNPRSRLFIDEAKKDYKDRSEGYLQEGYYRYKRFIKDVDLFMKQFENIPFLNGGLFDCLDKRINGKEIRVDCFSDNPKNETRLKVPDKLFFLEEEIEVDLKKHLDPNSKKPIKKKVRGLLPILKSYNFTIDENTPVDEEVALDPELLGKVFENLLASYNPETKTTARKATGSYYTPRDIVEYMVDESIIAYLKTKLSNNTKEFEEKILSLLDYNEDKNPFENDEDTTKKIIEAIESVKIIDPACGSGAFPMGVLHKLVLILNKLDPENKYWYELQYQKAIKETEEAFKLGDKKEREERLKEINDAFDKSIKDPNYARKLFLIRNCIYGVDIQEIAVQISKLRFFISLLIEQQPDDSKPNRGIKSLPNLETKFVAANTLIKLPKMPDLTYTNDIPDLTHTNDIMEKIKKIFKLREEFFYANSRWQKLKLEQKEEKLKSELFELIQKTTEKINKEKIQNLKLEIEKLKKELEELDNAPKEIKEIGIQKTFFGKEEKINVNITQRRRNEIKEKIMLYEAEIKKLEGPHKEPAIEIAKKIVEFNPYDQNRSNSWFDPEWMFGIKDGFDIVIGNPPYIQLQNALNDKIKYADLYKDQNYETFDRTGDIYCLFYERGIELLKESGILSYITSNKWMRAAYGEKLRMFFLKHNPLILIDLGPAVFESSTVDTNILLIQKNKTMQTNYQPNFSVLAVTLQKDDRKNISRAIREKGITLTKLTKDAWVILSDIEQKLKEKIESIGRPLKDWDVKIYYGIKTGLNEAFIIDNKKREEILKSCKDKEERKRTEKIIKPILRGRDIHRYYYEWAGLWVIVIPAGWTNENRGKEKPEIFIKKTFPALMQYLKQFEAEAKKRDDQGDYWWELRHCTYYHEFEKEKVVYSEIVREPQFYLDKNKFYVEATSFLMTGKQLKYICGLLNSKPVSFFFKNYYAGGGLGEEGYRYKKAFLENLPLPPITSSNESIVKQIESLVDKILSSKKQNPNTDTSELEKEIDKIVYKLYDLTEEEIKIIENSTK